METTFSTLSELFSQQPALRKCSRLSLARLLSQSHEQQLNQNEALFSADSKADYSYLIISGELALSSSDGKRALLKHGLIGEEAALGITKYANSVNATQISRVLKIPTSAMRSLMAETRGLHDALVLSYHHLFERTEDIQAKLTQLVDKSIHTWRTISGWLLALIVPLCIYLYFSASSELSFQQIVYLMVSLSAIVMWIFGLLPEFVPALFAVLVLILLGVAPPEVMLSGYMADSFFIALSIFGLSAVITASGLSYRFLLWLLRYGPANKTWYGVSLFSTGVMLTPAVPSTDGRIAIMSPLMQSLLQSMSPDIRNKEIARFSAITLGSVSLLSAIFLSSKTINFVTFGYLPAQEQEQFQWLFWLYAALVVGIVITVLFWLAVAIFFRTGTKFTLDKNTIKQQLHILGPLTRMEWAGICGLMVLLLSFFTAQFHQIAVPWVTLTILLGLLFFGFLDSKTFQHKINWNYLIFLASLIGMVSAMQFIGLDQWMTLKLSWLSVAMSSDFSLFVLMLALSLFVIRLILPINPTVIIFASLLIPTAINVGVNPWLVGFLILFFSETVIMPYQAGYFMNFCSTMEAAELGPKANLVAFQLLVAIFKLVAIYASFPFWHYLGLL